MHAHTHTHTSTHTGTHRYTDHNRTVKCYTSNSGFAQMKGCAYCMVVFALTLLEFLWHSSQMLSDSNTGVISTEVSYMYVPSQVLGTSFIHMARELSGLLTIAVFFCTLFLYLTLWFWIVFFMYSHLSMYLYLHLEYAF